MHFILYLPRVEIALSIRQLLSIKILVLIVEVESQLSPRLQFEDEVLKKEG
jgi:hypothetical protein